MGLFDLFSSDVVCPHCGQTGARKSLFGKIRCPNSSCQHFDPDLMYQREEERQLRELQAASSPVQPTDRDPRSGAPVRGTPRWPPGSRAKRSAVTETIQPCTAGSP